MLTSSARVQAAVAAGLALVLGGAWLLFGTPVRVRWLVARGAPPAGWEASAGAAASLRALGSPARPTLVGILEDSSTSRARKSWVASVLLRAPFFGQAEVERALSSPGRPAARAAAFALMGGEEDAESFEERASRAESGVAVPAGRAPVETWDPAPAIPVLLDWLGDGSDPEARYAALLLGQVPPGDARVREALLKAVEEVPEILAGDAPENLGERKLVVVNALQSLLAWARDDPEVASRVAKVVAWIEETGRSDRNWDLQAYALRLFEVGRGRGVDPALLKTLAHSGSPVIRQRLANALETITGAEVAGLLRELVGDESPTVRRSAVLTLRKRKDRLLLELLSYLVEDSYIYVRSDALRTVGELKAQAPEKCREALPLLVSCLEEPWPGPDVEASSPLASYFSNAKADVVEACALSLYMIAGQSPGFEPNAILDGRKRPATCQALAGDPAKRRAAAEEWRKTVPPWPEPRRVPFLVLRLEDRDPDNVVRAARELARIVPGGPGFPREVLDRGPDDTGARNAVRDLRKRGEWAKTVEAWKARK